MIKRFTLENDLIEEPVEVPETIAPEDNRAGETEAQAVELSADITISDEQLQNGDDEKKPEYYQTLLYRLQSWGDDKIVLHYSGVWFVQVIGENTYYLPNDDGSISSFAAYKFDKNAIVAPEPIVQGYDDKYYLQSQVPEKPLDELKAEKRTAINTARDAAEQGGFEYMGKIFDSDPISCQRISCAAQAMQVSVVSEEIPTITWTTQDNSTIDLTPAELMGLVSALALHSNTCHQKATALKAQIENAQTAEEIEEISWEYNKEEVKNNIDNTPEISDNELLKI